MKIIAKTGNGYILEAHEYEIKAVLLSFGMEKPEPCIGQTIPLSDYTAKIEYLKKFVNTYEFRQLTEYISKLASAVSDVEVQLNEIKETPSAE